jgi:hypothetical protein
MFLQLKSQHGKPFAFSTQAELGMYSRAVSVTTYKAIALSDFM